MQCSGLLGTCTHTHARTHAHSFSLYVHSLICPSCRPACCPHTPLPSVCRCAVAPSNRNQVNAETNHLDLAINPSVTATPSVGDCLVAKVAEVQADKLKMQVGPRLYGWVHVTDTSDKFTAAGTNGFSVGQLVKSIVVDIPDNRKRLQLSLRPSQVLGTGKVINPKVQFDDVKVDDVLTGYISSIGDRGAFVALGHDVIARVLIANLSDSFIKDFATSFPAGKMVVGRVLSVDKKRKKIDLSLKQ